MSSRLESGGKLDWALVWTSIRTRSAVLKIVSVDGDWEGRSEKMRGRGVEGPRSTVWGRKYDMEPWILDPKLIGAASSQESPLFMILRTFLAPLILFGNWLTMTHNQPRGSIPPLIESSHRSSTFPFNPIFFHDESLCFVLITHFSLIIISGSSCSLPMLYEAELSGTFSSDSLLRNRLLILTMLLSRSWSPSCI